MMKFLLCIVMLILLSVPVYAAELEAPLPPAEVMDIIPEDSSNFTNSVWHIIKSSVSKLYPDLQKSLQTCMCCLCAVVLMSIFNSMNHKVKGLIELVSAIALSSILLSGTDALIQIGAQTVAQLSDYGKLFIPVMTGALAAQGGVTTAAAIYAATAMVNALLASAISAVLLPMVYIYLALSIANCAIGEDLIKEFRDFMKWLMSFAMKTLLYIFTGYVTITGVISGATDMTAIKATRLTISGMVPVIGGILSDTSEAVLIGAGVMKNTVGTAGMLAILAIIIGPFLKIGINYLLLRLTGTVSSLLSDKKSAALIQDFSTAMGFVLAMTGTVCIILIISTVCMMRGING